MQRRSVACTPGTCISRGVRIYIYIYMLIANRPCPRRAKKLLSINPSAWAWTTVVRAITFKRDNVYVYKGRRRRGRKKSVKNIIQLRNTYTYTRFIRTSRIICPVRSRHSGTVVRIYLRGVANILKTDNWNSKYINRVQNQWHISLGNSIKKITVSTVFGRVTTHTHTHIYIAKNIAHNHTNKCYWTYFDGRTHLLRNPSTSTYVFI